MGINTRRKIQWDRLAGIRAWSAFATATACGAGLSPYGPGTAGTLFAIPLAYSTQNWEFWARLGLWIGILGIGTWSAKVFDELMETSDNQNVVIDEVLGLGIASWAAGESLAAWIAAFLFFRLFDITKPPPVRQFDRWSKNASGWLGGFMVMMDDLVAGFQALAIVLILQWLHVV